MKVLLVLLLQLFAIAVASAQNPCDRIRARKAEIFNPDDRSSMAATVDLREVDKFWALVELAGPTGLDCLKELLSKEDSDHFFIDDGSALALHLDSSKEMYQFALELQRKGSMYERSPYHYVKLLINAAHRGADIREATWRYLEKGKPYMIERPKPAMMEKPSVAAYLFGVMEESVADAELMKALASTNDEIKYSVIASMSMLLSEWSIKTIDSLRKHDSLIMKAADKLFLTQELPPKPTSVYAREQILDTLRAMAERRIPAVIHNNEQLVLNIAHALGEEDLPLLKAARRVCYLKPDLRAAGDHQMFSQLILAIIHKERLYEEYRL